MALASGLVFFFLILALSHSKCPSECDTALASYYISEGQDLTYISNLFGIPFSDIESKVLPYNHIPGKDRIAAGMRINIPFPCRCSDGNSLAGTFTYSVRKSDTYNKIAEMVYANLTTVDRLAADNGYSANSIPENATFRITVGCSCGDEKVSKEYGLFVTYPPRPGDSLGSVAAELGISSLDLIQRYNPGVDFSFGEGIVYVPTKGEIRWNYHHLSSKTDGFPHGAVAAISIAGAVVLIFAICLYGEIIRRKKARRVRLLTSTHENFNLHRHGHGTVSDIVSPFTSVAEGSSSPRAYSLNKSVEFSYEELAKATNDFNLAKVVGEGAFGTVYYAELKGEKTAIKKMAMTASASKGFLAELQVLTNVHHSNLVRLIGYCIKDSLFLVYEYIEKGNLNEHLRSSDKEPLPWSTRMQIALDAAMGLQYIHENIVPPYIHRDIKSANILIDGNFRGKVGDFGLAKLTEAESTLLTKNLLGTFGYMAPESANGEVSCKSDFYAFGVVLYEPISAKSAIINTSDSGRMALITLFDDVLNQPDPKDGLHKLVDPRLGDNYPIDIIYEVALLAKDCTQKDAKDRPNMHFIATTLFSLSSSTADLYVSALRGNQAFTNLMSGR